MAGAVTSAAMRNQGPFDRLDRRLFRFAVVSQVITAMTAGQPRSAAVAAAAAMLHLDGSGQTQRVSRRSVYRWLAAYRLHGVTGLADPARAPRPDKQAATLIDFLLAEIKEDREASIPELIERARQQSVVKYGASVDRTTIYRALRRRGVSLTRAKKRRGRDSRRFAFPHRMDMVMCDGKHFRVGQARLRRVALFYLDDASRKVLHVVVGTAESTLLFLRGLKECIQEYGLMTTVYLDHGAGFDANDTREVIANLGELPGKHDVHLVLGETGYPQGRGKVEKFNRTAQDDVLRKLDSNPDVDPDLGSLELRLRHYVNHVYGGRPHGGLGRDTPNQRFDNDTRPLRPVDDRAKLEAAFVIKHERTVTHDHVISLKGVAYEMPRGYAGRKVTVIRPIFEHALFFDHEGRRIRLHPVDLQANARAKRARPDIAPEDVQRPSPGTSSAGHRFREDHPPLVDEDGGCLPGLPGDPDVPDDDRDPTDDADEIPF